jgi:glycosyltransferase involved in cell wall biosynthesis
VKLLVIHPRLEPPGGGEAVGAWALQALQHRHQVTLAVAKRVDFSAVNRFYGTSLDPARIETVLLPAPFRWVADLLPTRAGLIESSMLFRWARRLQSHHDLVVSTSNEWDFGEPGVQYIHFPRTYLPRPPSDLRWYHVGAGVVEAYQRFCRRLGRADLARIRWNLTLANSEWTARHYEDWHGVAARVVYPPVPGGFPDTPWEKRSPKFLCVGRVSPEKRVEQVIEILRRVREAGEKVGLDLIGSPGAPHYARKIRALVQHHRDWIVWHERLPRKEFVQALAGHRYGLHAMPDEHFGIAVAEMLRAGCIPFVPSDGGPMEIVGGDSRISYSSTEDAVEKVLALLRSPEREDAVRRELAPRRELFSEDRFMSEFLSAVESFTPVVPDGSSTPSGQEGIER